MHLARCAVAMLQPLLLLVVVELPFELAVAVGGQHGFFSAVAAGVAECGPVLDLHG